MSVHENGSYLRGLYFLRSLRIVIAKDYMLCDNTVHRSVNILDVCLPVPEKNEFFCNLCRLHVCINERNYSTVHDKLISL